MTEKLVYSGAVRGAQLTRHGVLDALSAHIASLENAINAKVMGVERVLSPGLVFRSFQLRKGDYTWNSDEWPANSHAEAAADVHPVRLRAAMMLALELEKLSRL